MIHHYLFYIILYFTSYHYFECWNSCWIRWDSIVSILFWVVPSCNQAWQWKQSLFTVDFPTKTAIYRWFSHIFSFKADFRWLFPATFEATNEVKPHDQRHPTAAFVQSHQRGLNVPKMLECSAQAEGESKQGPSVHRESLDVMEIRIIYIIIYYYYYYIYIYYYYYILLLLLLLLLLL